MRQSVVTHHTQHGPQSGARVQIHEAPGFTPGSGHNRMEESPEAVTYAKNDGMKTRVTITPGPQHIVGSAVKVMGPTALAPQALQLTEGAAPLSLDQVIEQLRARADAQREAIEKGEHDLEETLSALDLAQDEYLRGKQQGAEQRIARRKLDEERKQLEADRLNLDRERAELDAVRHALDDRLDAEAATRDAKSEEPTDPPPATSKGALDLDTPKG